MSVSHDRESFGEQLDRLRQMADADGDWDLSDNDRVAIAALLNAHAALLAALKEFLENPNYDIAIGGNPHAVEAMLERASAAIAKAEGREAAAYVAELEREEGGARDQ